METTRLEMFFMDEIGEKVKLSLDEPKVDLTSTEIEQAMNNIIATNAFKGKGGKFVSAVGAQIVTTNITELDF